MTEDRVGIGGYHVGKNEIRTKDETWQNGRTEVGKIMPHGTRT